jgi:hypothetical protein
MASPRRSFQVFLELPLPPDAAKVLQGGAPTIEVPDAFKVVPDHLKGLPVENELGAGIERPEYPPMTADQLFRRWRSSCRATRRANGMESVRRKTRPLR